MGYFVFHFLGGLVLPEIPPVLLGLTSAAASVYVGNKAAHRNAPQITSVSPLTAKAGDHITAFGINFDPVGPTRSDLRITVALTGHDGTIYPTRCDSATVEFTMPDGVTVGRIGRRHVDGWHRDRAAGDPGRVGRTVRRQHGTAEAHQEQPGETPGTQPRPTRRAGLG
ncbi:MAG TPA: hypothetical protein VHF25_17115 [Nitriliruptorales bacterium]|nr:hypothetical protein [Nitriliruptorales bacterium]